MNQKLPKDKAKLQYLTTIQKGWLPPIIEDLSGDDTQDASKNSLNCERHQNMYYPLEGISEQELQQKVQQLGEQAQVKSPIEPEHS